MDYIIKGPAQGGSRPVAIKGTHTISIIAALYFRRASKVDQRGNRLGGPVGVF